MRTERKRFYSVAIPLLAVGIVALWSLPVSNYVLRGVLVTFVLVILAAIANFRIKLLLRALFAFYCSAILFRINTFLGGVALALALILSWSRPYLQRHDLAEMMTGTLLRLGGGMVAAWWQ